jgi:hypothetical protein
MSQAVVQIAEQSGNGSAPAVMAEATRDRDKCTRLSARLAGRTVRYLSSLETGVRCTVQTATPHKDSSNNSKGGLDPQGEWLEAAASGERAVENRARTVLRASPQFYL